MTAGARRSAGGTGLLAAVSVTLAFALAFAPAFAPAAAAQAGWGRPFQFAPPGSLDDLGPQIAFSPAGASAAAFGIQDVDAPGVSQAYVTTRSARGKVGKPLLIGGAREVLALSYDGPALELLTGSSPSGQTCCSAVQAVALSARGHLGRPRALVSGLTGATLARLLTLADGRMLAAMATERGVWVVQSSQANRFTTTHRLSGAGQVPVSMDAAWLGGESTAVAWTVATGSPGGPGPRTIYLAAGSLTAAPRQVRRELTVAAGHRIDELALARRGSAATLAWIESWYDSRGTYHSQVRVADAGPHPVARPLSPAGALASGLTLDADAAGDQGVSWSSCTIQEVCSVDAAVRGAGANFGAPRRLGSVDASQAPSLALGSHGEVVVGWVRGGQPVAAAGSAGGGGFGSPAALSSSTFALDLTVGFGPGRQALAAWTQGTLNPSIVGASYQSR